MESSDYLIVPARICPVCGAAETLKNTVQNLPFDYRGQRVVIDVVHSQQCSACGELFADANYPEDWQRMSAAMEIFSRQVDADLARALRSTRKKLGLNQAEAGRLFGGGASAFSEYERGKTQPHKSTVLLFKLLNKHPELLNELKGMAD